MIRPTPAFLLVGSLLLAGCDMALTEDAKAKVEETTQAAESLKNTFNSEVQKAKEGALTTTQETIASSLSEETHKQIDSVKQKAEDIGNMKVSDLLSFGGESEAESEEEQSQ